MFLGGLIAALALRLTFAPYSCHVLAWVALLPLFYSLYRNRQRPWFRFLHAMTFSLLLLLWCNSWFFTALAGSGRADGASLLDSTRAAAGSSLAWIAIALFSGVFAVASGPLLRSERTLPRLLGIPALWTGLEVLRGPVSPVHSPWISGWLSLGYCLDPGSPEAQVASVVGVYGLSFLVVLSSTCLLLCLVSGRLRRQLAYAFLACASPLLALAYGKLASPRDVALGDTPIAIISQVGDSPDTILPFASGVAATNPAIILCSDVALGPIASSGDLGSREVVEEFLTRLASLWDGAAEGGGIAQAARGSGTVLLTESGRLVGVYLSPPSTPARAAQTATGDARTYQSAAGSFGLGLNFDDMLPSRARAACASGAELLVSSVFSRADWGENARAQQLNMASFRAVENRRWLVYASSLGAYVVDPYGRLTLELRGGFDGAGVESVSFLKERSFYTLYGWWIEPLCALAALVLVAAAARPRVFAKPAADRRMTRPHGGEADEVPRMTPDSHGGRT